MILLRRGTNLPTVALTQCLLNEILDLSLSVDGDFGSDTEEVVRRYQQMKRITVDGIVGPNCWRRLSQDRSLKIIDHVDAADDYLDTENYIGYQRDLHRVGVSPIVSSCESSGIPSVANLIKVAAGGGGVVLLRFHGHGGPGSMALTRGRGGMAHIHADSISLFALDWRYIQRYFGPLHRIFHPLGSVELHGCNVAGDLYDHGRRIQSRGVGIGRYLLQRLSQLLNVPVSASPNSQYSHGTAILPFEGQTLTVCPDGSTNIMNWARNKVI